MKFLTERKLLAKYMCRLYDKGLTTCSGGNISMKDAADNIFITVSQRDKGKTSCKDIAVINSDNKLLTPSLKPSMETNMHMEIYENRPDVFAIVHSHPVYTSVFAVSHKKIESRITGESAILLGNISYADYEYPGSEKLANICAEALKKSNVLVMKNHGAICLGNDIFEAYDRMEVLEFTAKVNYLALISGTCKSLTEEEIMKINRG